MNARDVLTQLTSEHLSPLLRHAGFKKSGFTYRRPIVDMTHVINLQLSDANQGLNGRFYINVGLYVPPVSILMGRTLIPTPKEYECHLRYRLERILPDVPARWDFTSVPSGYALAASLAHACQRLLTILNPIDSLEQLLHSALPQGAAELEVYAQISFLLGHEEAARTALQQAAAVYRTRSNWQLDHWLNRLGLRALGPSLGVP